MIGYFSGVETGVSNIEWIVGMNHAGWTTTLFERGKSRWMGPNRKELEFSVFNSI